MFLTVVMTVWAIVHAYVFWRLSSLPWVAGHISRRTLVIVAVALWVSYPVARMLLARHWTVVGIPLEFIASTWMGLLFLMLASLLLTDLVTVGGFLVPRAAPALRGGAVLVAGGLALVALVQGLRAPVVRDYEVRLPGLPRERDGLVLVAISDLHLGTLIGGGWMQKLITRINALQPDVIVVVGDLVDANVDHAERLVPVLKALQAPLGVWAVTGNHEFYAGIQRSVRVLEDAGYVVLRDRAVEVAPGLVLAGVDDLTARRQFGLDHNPFEKALANRPAGATILLSHTPWGAEVAARANVGLMLSGHTHNGQIWPFNYLVGMQYPLMGGRYSVNGVTAIVCRGTGTWGPRMRLWQPSELLRIKLRAAS